MTTRISTTLQNVIADNVASTMSGATLAIYTGAQPANANASVTGTKLVEFTGLSWTSATAGVNPLDVSGSPQANAVASGTAGWGRLVAGTYVIDGAVGTSGQQWNITSTTITSGDLVTLNSANITAPAA